MSSNRTKDEGADVVVVGGGIAGLAAAAYAARAGRAVTLLERASYIGGRAITEERSGYYFNLGPHALYRAGPGVKVLRELGVPIHGRVPPSSGLTMRGGELQTLPASPWSVMATNLLGFGDKLEMSRIFATFTRIDTSKLGHVSVAEWLQRKARSPRVRELFTALVRLGTYANEPERMSAAVAVRQLQMALKGVYYLDHGWQTLVDGLRSVAEAAGARIVTSAPVVAIERGPAPVVRVDGGRQFSASAVILAATPRLAADLLDEPGLASFAEAATPVRAAALDIGLSALPRPRDRFVLGIDTPLYFSVHSDYGDLAPEGGAVVQLAKYLGPEQPDAKALEGELETLMDLAQPGWRELVVERRFLPNLVVANVLPTAEQGGLAGRPGPEIAGVPNVFLAGDWVGGEGWLVDAPLASARRAAHLANEALANEALAHEAQAAARSAVATA